jgi:hypothetical protein
MQFSHAFSHWNYAVKQKRLPASKAENKAAARAQPRPTTPPSRISISRRTTHHSALSELDNPRNLILWTLRAGISEAYVVGDDLAHTVYFGCLPMTRASCSEERLKPAFLLQLM